jgi:hypothetical protein
MQTEPTNLVPGEPTLHLRGHEVGTIFELIGRDENALTFALGWCLAKVPSLLFELVRLLGATQLGTGVKVVLQEHSGKNGITDIELRAPGHFAWIIEAKVGHEPPSIEQLKKYATKLNDETEETASKMLVVLAQSDRRDLWLKRRVPSFVLGVPVQVLSWMQIKAAIDQAYPASHNTGKALLRQLRDFIESLLSMQTVTSNETYVVSVSWDTWGGGETTFIEVVEKFGKYFHPIGSGWPANPPNYIAFRWSGRLQSIHHVDSYEIITDFHQHFPTVPAAEVDPHFLYHLGPAMRPAHEVRTGNIFRNGRVWAHLDLLMTEATISDARDKTKKRMEAAIG